MTDTLNDYGSRCTKHYGEVFMPRCNACESLNTEYRLLHIEGTPNAS